MNQKYVMNMMEIASDFDAISTELFALSHNAADNPQYDPKTKLYSLHDSHLSDHVHHRCR